MDKERVKKTVIRIVVIVVVLALLIAFYSTFPKTAFLLPTRSFFKVFPEYDIAAEDLDYIEVGYRNKGVIELKRMTDSESKSYMEKLSKERVRFNWMTAIGIALGDSYYARAVEFKAVFHKKDGSIEELQLRFEGNPNLYQRINETNYYNVFGNSGLLPKQS